MKRSLDLILASVLLVFSVPLLLVIAAIVATDGGPVFYRQQRVGAGGKLFGCLKFRTMIFGAEQCLDEYLSYHPQAAQEWIDRRKLMFDPRVTAIGDFLRRSSLDELPQLWNVIRGEMSLVGPRPITKSELSYYGDVAALYFSVRPGITGLWQVSGRSDTDYPGRVSIDADYVRNWSLALDLRIMLRTPAVVLSHRGAR